VDAGLPFLFGISLSRQKASFAVGERDVFTPPHPGRLLHPRVLVHGKVDARTGEEVEAVLRSVASLPEDLIAKASEMTRR
jgi:hypothetical protein